MDVWPAALWIALAVVLAGGVALLALHRRSPQDGPGPDAPPIGYVEDDLPGFLEAPPGSAGRPQAPPGGWPALAATAPAPTPRTVDVPARAGRRWSAVLAAATVAALLAAALVAVLGPSAPHPAPDGADGRPAREAVDLPAAPAAPTPGDGGAGDLADAAVRPGRDGGAARLGFAGLVLEQRAVGVTATYPALDVSWNGGRAVAHLRLPTFNCLSATAPEDPVAAGCVTSVTEYADLPSPALAVTGIDGRVRLSGRFPTYVRPNGSPPVWTGRVYEIGVLAAPVDGEPPDGWVRAEGEIRLGSGRAPTLDGPDVTVLTRD